MAHIRLHVRQANGHLPMVCMRCAATAAVVKTKKMTWYPRWIVVFVLLGAPGILVAVLLAMLFLRKTARLQAPLCEQHAGHWTVRTVLTWISTGLALLTGIGAIALMIALDNVRPRGPANDLAPWICLGSVVIFVAWLVVIAVVQNTAIRPDEITDTHILLNGVSEEFVDAVEEAEIERRVRLRQWEYEDEAERPRRRGDDWQAAPRDTAPRKASRDGAFEEGPPRPAPPDAFEA